MDLPTLKTKKKIKQSFDEDFKFQSIAASLVEKGINLNDIMISLKGQHKRAYAKEIQSIEQYPFNKKKIKLNLRKNGIYDLMPQTYFHDYKKYGNSNLKKMIEESRELRKEEDEFRNLFFPFECILHRQTIKTELKEREIYNEGRNFLYKKLFKLYTIKYNDIPHYFLNKFYSLLPYTGLIQKNNDFIQEAFGICTKEKVIIKIKKSKVEKYIDGKELSKAKLGIDSICGNSFIPVEKIMSIDIGPIIHWEVSDISENTTLQRFVDLLIETFVPYFYKTKVKYIFDSNSIVLKENNTESNSWLGYNTAI